MTGTLLDLAELAVRAEVPVERLRQQLAAAVTARLNQVQADIAAQNGQAVEAGPGTAGWATKLDQSASLTEDAARLQAVSVVTYCAGPSCGRSKVAAAAFGRLGYRDVRVYEGGKTDWAASGLPFEGDRAAAGAAQ